MTTKSSNSPIKKTKRRANGEGSVYFVTKLSCWVAAIHDMHGKRKTNEFETEDAAFVWINEQKKQRSQGLYLPLVNEKQTVAEYLFEWVERNKNQKKPATSCAYLGRIRNQIVPNIGHLNAATLPPKAVEDLLSKLIDDDYAAGTVLGTYRTLGAAYSDGFRLGEFEFNPIKRVKTPKLKSKSTRQIPDADAALIYKFANTDPFLLARVEVGMVCGLRPGEVMGLKWTDIDWNKHTLTIERQIQRVNGQGLVFQPVKQGRTRTIALSPVQIDILRKHFEAQDALSKPFNNVHMLVFPNTEGGMLDDRRDTRIWKKLCKDAGVPPYQRYQMRKTAYSKLYAELRNLPEFMAYSGHTQVSTVMDSYVFANENADSHIRRSIDAIRPKTAFESDAALRKSKKGANLLILNSISGINS